MAKAKLIGVGGQKSPMPLPQEAMGGGRQAGR